LTGLFIGALCLVHLWGHDRGESDTCATAVKTVINPDANDRKVYELSLVQALKSLPSVIYRDGWEFFIKSYWSGMLILVAFLAVCCCDYLQNDFLQKITFTGTFNDCVFSSLVYSDGEIFSVVIPYNSGAVLFSISDFLVFATVSFLVVFTLLLRYFGADCAKIFLLYTVCLVSVIAGAIYNMPAALLADIVPTAPVDLPWLTKINFALDPYCRPIRAFLIAQPLVLPIVVVLASSVSVADTLSNGSGGLTLARLIWPDSSVIENFPGSVLSWSSWEPLIGYTASITGYTVIFKTLHDLFINGAPVAPAYVAPVATTEDPFTLALVLGAFIAIYCLTVLTGYDSGVRWARSTAAEATTSTPSDKENCDPAVVTEKRSEPEMLPTAVVNQH
jgi:hypothetical protein